MRIKRKEGVKEFVDRMKYSGGCIIESDRKFESDEEFQAYVGEIGKMADRGEVEIFSSDDEPIIYLKMVDSKGGKILLDFLFEEEDNSDN